MRTRISSDGQLKLTLMKAKNFQNSLVTTKVYGIGITMAVGFNPHGTRSKPFHGCVATIGLREIYRFAFPTIGKMICSLSEVVCARFLLSWLRMLMEVVYQRESSLLPVSPGFENPPAIRRRRSQPNRRRSEFRGRQSATGSFVLHLVGRGCNG